MASGASHARDFAEDFFGSGAETRVFHSPQEKHFPCHLDEAAPQLEQTYMVGRLVYPIVRIFPGIAKTSVPDRLGGIDSKNHTMKIRYQ